MLQSQQLIFLCRKSFGIHFDAFHCWIDTRLARQLIFCAALAGGTGLPAAFSCQDYKNKTRYEVILCSFKAHRGSFWKSLTESIFGMGSVPVPLLKTLFRIQITCSHTELHSCQVLKATLLGMIWLLKNGPHNVSLHINPFHACITGTVLSPVLQTLVVWIHSECQRIQSSGIPFWDNVAPRSGWHGRALLQSPPSTTPASLPFTRGRGAGKTEM